MSLYRVDALYWLTRASSKPVCSAMLFLSVPKKPMYRFMLQSWLAHRRLVGCRAACRCYRGFLHPAVAFMHAALASGIACALESMSVPCHDRQSHRHGGAYQAGHPKSTVTIDQETSQSKMQKGSMRTAAGMLRLGRGGGDAALGDEAAAGVAGEVVPLQGSQLPDSCMRAIYSIHLSLCTGRGAGWHAVIRTPAGMQTSRHCFSWWLCPGEEHLHEAGPALRGPHRRQRTGRASVRCRGHEKALHPRCGRTPPPSGSRPCSQIRLTLREVTCTYLLGLYHARSACACMALDRPSHHPCR